MRVVVNDPPRTFEAGMTRVQLKDCGRVELGQDEQVTFVTDSGGEYDVARKAWGFYATPSTNARLAGFGLRAVIMKNEIGRYFVVLVESGRERQFEQYVRDERQTIVAWLDTTEACERLAEALK